MRFVRSLFRLEAHGCKRLPQQCVQICQIRIGLDAGPDNSAAVSNLEPANVFDADGEYLMLKVLSALETGSVSASPMKCTVTCICSAGTSRIPRIAGGRIFSSRRVMTLGKSSATNSLGIFSGITGHCRSLLIPALEQIIPQSHCSRCHSYLLDGTGTVVLEFRLPAHLGKYIGHMAFH